MKPHWLIHALKDNGLKEVKGGNHNPRIVEMHASTTLKARDDETSWCSSAMNMWMKESGFKPTRSAAAISWESWGTPIDDFRVGAIVILNRYSPTNPRARHVTLCTEDRGNTFVGFGGNQGDMCKHSVYSKKEVTAIVWPLGG